MHPLRRTSSIINKTEIKDEDFELEEAFFILSSANLVPVEEIAHSIFQTTDASSADSKSLADRLSLKRSHDEDDLARKMAAVDSEEDDNVTEVPGVSLTLLDWSRETLKSFKKINKITGEKFFSIIIF